MKNELISIIVPVYNVEKYLEKCLDSITNQTYKNLEIIVIDDGSTDKSGIICDKYAQKDNRIKVIHKLNGGLSDARNAGLDICTGDYIGFVDSDDYIEPDMYEYLLEKSKETNADVSMCNFYIEDERSDNIKLAAVFDEFVSDDKEIILKFYLENNILIGIWNKLFKCEVLNNIRFPKQHCCEDTYIMADWVDKINKFMCSNSCKYHYIHRGNSLSNRGVDKYLLDEIYAFGKVDKYIKNKNMTINEISEKCILESYMVALKRLCLEESINKINDDKKKCIRNYLRRHFILMLKNQYLTIKQKMIFSLMIIDDNIYKSLKKLYQRIK